MIERPPFKPFPKIARFPEEPSLDGTPQSEADSIFLSVPELSRAATLVVELSNMKSDQKRSALEQQVTHYMTRPKEAVAFFDALAMMDENNVNQQKTITLRDNLLNMIDRGRVSLEQFTPEVLHDWLELYAESAVYRPLAEQVLRRVIERCSNAESTTTILYNLTLGGLRSSNPRIRRLTLEILTYQSPLLPPDSKPGMHYLLAGFDLDDRVLQRSLEIDGAAYFLCNQDQTDLIERKGVAQDQIVDSPAFTRQLDKIAQSQPNRFLDLQAFYDHVNSDSGVINLETDNIHSERFPWKLVIQGGPLRRWLNDYMAREITAHDGGPERVSLHLPDRDLVIDRPVQQAIMTALQAETVRSNDIFEESMYWETLAHLTPLELSADNCQQLLALNQLLREDMRFHTRYLLSPRGDSVDIQDAKLNALGLQNITFEMNPQNKRETIVTVTVGKHRFRLMLDEFFTTKQLTNRQDLTLPRDGEFIQSVILAHLHAIRCSEGVVESSTKTDQPRTGARSAFMARRAHLRRLPSGHRPTSEQIKLALEDYDIDIIRLNRESAARQQSAITFVSETEPAVAGALGPVRSQAHEAANEIHQILGV